MAEKTYRQKREFGATPEPQPAVDGDVDPTTATPGSSFVIQQHYATRLHHDLRLEMMNGEVPVLVSWAVPKGLPLTKGKPHLAVHVEDHPIEYGTFAGTIPEGNYGAGEVRIFDSGTYEMLEQEPGKLTFRLNGERLKGEWHMIVPKNAEPKNWLAFLRSDDRQASEPPPEPLLPMMATLEGEAFDSTDWIFEIKWDGVRTLAVCIGDETMLLSRRGRDVTATYPEFNKLHERLVAVDAIVDGEIVAFSDGKPSFERLQGRMNLQNEREIERATKRIPISFIAFDLLYLDGRSLVDEPVERRKELLEEVLVPTERVILSQFEAEAGTAMFEAARLQGLEGVVAKRLGSPYRSGRRSREWLKIKTVHDADVVVGGWSRGEGSRSGTFGALLVGAYDGDDLHFLGAVGTGFTEKLLDQILPLLRECETGECPFVEGAEGIRSGRFGKPIKDPHWTQPFLVARVQYRELTSGHRLRAPSFKGLRTDKAPEDCLIDELPGAAAT